MREKTLFVVFIAALSLISSSCGVMRSIGLYNTSPSYCDELEESFNKKCPDHNNSINNLSIYIRPCKNIFSPYEEIEIEVGIINHSDVDAMSCYKPDYIWDPWSESDLDIRDSLNHKLDLLDGRQVDYVTTIESNGRRLSPSVFTSEVIINPQDTLIEIFKINPGTRYPDLLKNRNKFLFQALAKRENLPGKYSIYYEQKHEELDKIRGLIPAGKLVSDTVEYYVRDYTPEEANLRKDVAGILEGVIGQTYDKNTADSLITKLSERFPDNFYLEMVKIYAANYFYLDTPKNKK